MTDNGELIIRHEPVVDTFDLLGTTVSYWRAGTGEPILVLHDDTGHGTWGRFLDVLAEQFTVVAPAMPGFPPSTVPDWMRSVPEMAAMMQQVVDRLGLGSCTVVGFGFGAWVAAEMQVQCPTRFSRMVLAAPVGIKPLEGEIVDRYLFGEERFVEMGFADKAHYVEAFGDPDEVLLLTWEGAREMSTRIAWKPYMFDRALPHLLAAATVPTLVLWGEGDAIVPRSCAEQYAQIMPNATLTTLPGGGHRLDLELPDEVARLVHEFVSDDSRASTTMERTT
ncbi:MAG: alpha/beta fold hydrolase [Acidimicrobiia bacterium]